jgi:hypothetical protein
MLDQANGSRRVLLVQGIWWLADVLNRRVFFLKHPPSRLGVARPLWSAWTIAKAVFLQKKAVRRKILLLFCNSKARFESKAFIVNMAELSSKPGAFQGSDSFLDVRILLPPSAKCDKLPSSK